MKVWVGFVWLNICGMLGYLMVILAMLYGWGIKPASWFLVIFFYFIANNIFFIMLCVRKWLEDEWPKRRRGDHA